MGTSNPQHIPYVVSLIQKSLPWSVLDIGVGFGRTGWLVREFMEVWNDRVLPDQWMISLYGIEAFEAQLTPIQRTLYSAIMIGDAYQMVTDPSHEHYEFLQQGWDLIVLGDVLEHWEKQTAIAMMDWSLKHAKNVILAIPIGSGAVWRQDPKYGNPYEQHKSEWTRPEISQRWKPSEYRMFVDYIQRDHGVFFWDHTHER